jgi:hypothetical protein
VSVVEMGGGWVDKPRNISIADDIPQLANKQIYSINMTRYGIEFTTTHADVFTFTAPREDGRIIKDDEQFLVIVNGQPGFNFGSWTKKIISKAEVLYEFFELKTELFSEFFETVNVKRDGLRLHFQEDVHTYDCLIILVQEDSVIANFVDMAVYKIR